MIDCRDATERLPWLLNGSLAEPEREAVRQHLATCAACRREWQETASAAAVFAQHVPPGLLVDYSFGRVARPDLEWIEPHLAACRVCEDELALVQESRRLEADGADLPDPVSRQASTPWQTQRPSPTAWRFDWRSAGLAAAAVLAFGVILEQRRPRVTEPQPPGVIADARPQPQTAPPSSDTGRPADAATITKLESDLARLRSPQVNTTTVDVYPLDRAERSAATGERSEDLRLSRAAAQATLILNSQAATHPSYALEIRDARDARVWRGEGLVRHATGDYTVTLSPAFLGPGRYTLVVYGEGRGQSTPIERYRVVIE